MTPPANPERYKHHRFPGEIISHGVWLYYRFHLSDRDVQELLFERGVHVTYEAIRHGSVRFRANRVETACSSIHNPPFLLAMRGGDGFISHPKKPVWREI